MRREVLGELTLRLTICHLYPLAMSIYGDRGNVIALTQRAGWRGAEVTVQPHNLGDSPDFGDVDIFFFGGGQDKEQAAVSRDLRGDAGKALLGAVEAGSALLAICGGYQLLGHSFRTGSGDLLPGIGLFDAHTEAGARRFIGDAVVECDFADPASDASGPGTGVASARMLVGFENHSGRTTLGAGCRPMGRVIVGYGNDGSGRYEGAIYRSAFGCYLHGSLLPKNAWFTDVLLRAGLRRRYRGDVQLVPLDDALEDQAQRAVIERVRRRGQVQSAIRSR